MLASFLLILREVMEAALVITIVMAATRGVLGRYKFIWGGVAAGVLGAVALAAGMDAIGDLFDGVGQEIFSAAILLTAVGMVTWHVVWMSSHGRQLAEQIKAIGHDVKIGSKPLSALAIVIAAAVLREGAEIVLFMQGLMAGNTSQTDLMWGGVGGLMAGGVFGLCLYAGMIRIPMRHLFGVTNGMLIAIAAGMAAKAANYLITAGWLPELAPRVWDTSAIVADDTFLGETLSAFVGYTATPSGMQIVFFTATIAGIMLLSRKMQPSSQRAA